MIATYIPWLLSASGMLGVVLGVNRSLKRRQDDSKLLQVISFLTGIVLSAAPVAIVLRSGRQSEVSGVFNLLVLLLAICLVGQPLKDLPLSFIVVAAAGTGLFWLFSSMRQFSFAGDVPTQVIALAAAVLILLVFGVSFFIEKGIDLFLGLISRGPIVFIVAASALIHGLLIGLHITDHHGLLNLLK
jgi:hypothetical protein